MIKNRVLKLFSLALLAFSSLCYALSPEVKVTKLENGLKVVIKKTSKANVAVGMIWYKVGSADEPGGITGVSHALEHMMFKGTPSYPPNSYSKLISKNGGQENAFTNTDYTAYFAKIKSDKLPLFLELEADRMQNLTLDPKEFSKEIKVVMEERRLRTDDNPQSLLYERFMALSHLAAPYHHPVVGWMNDLQNMTIENLKGWYTKWYVPNNATIVIVGDVDIEKTLQLIKKYFGKLQSRPLPKRKPQLEPTNLGKKELNIKPNIKTNVPMILIGYNAPSLLTTKIKWHPYALEVIAGILSGGNSARLPKEIVRQKQSAIEASADYDLYARYDSQFTLFGATNSVKKLPKLEKDLIQQIKRLQSYLVSPAELKRIKNQVIATNVYKKDSVFGQAMEYGMLETIGLNIGAEKAYLNEIRAITPKQIQEVAKLYLNDSNISIARLFPNPKTVPNDKVGIRK